MADSQPPDPISTVVSAAPETSVQPTATTTETVGSKRQRRPSVRLGDIGGDHHLYDAHSKRGASNTHKALKQNYNINNDNQFCVDTKKDGNGLSNKGSSKTRALTNLSSGGDFNETLDGEKEGNLDGVAIGSWKVKDSKKRCVSGATKRVRSKHVYSKIDEEGAEFETENCESPLNEDSPVNSIDNLGDENERKGREGSYYNRRRIKGKDLANHRGGDGIELSCPSDNEANNDRFGGGEDGVRIWLNSIGLGRYAPVFEIHEVDDEVLPQLTLEDLKDMGITAVGSRRKMFSAIQKLSKGFS